MSKRKTGRLHKRNYGIEVRLSKYKKMFYSSAAHIIATFMLETKEEKKARGLDWSQRHNEKLEDVWEALRKKVREREGTYNVLTHSRRTDQRHETNLVLQNMTKRAKEFYGEVKSKGSLKINKGYYEFHLTIPPERRSVNLGYHGSRVNTKDQFFNDEKGVNLTVMGVHLAIPEISLYHDQKYSIPQDANMTGLFPRQRETGSSLLDLPFTFCDFKGDKNRIKSITSLSFHQDITDLIMDYYLNGETQYELSVKAMERLRPFSTELYKQLRSQNDTAQFKILRQREQELSDLTLTEDTHYASSRNLMITIYNYLTETWGYKHKNYVREFPGTEFEEMAIRLEPPTQGPVYSLLMHEKVPILVRRHLGEEKIEPNLIMYRELADEPSPLKKIKGEYFSIDPATGRSSTTEIVLPDETLRKEGITVPKKITRIYDRIRKQEYTYS